MWVRELPAHFLYFVKRGDTDIDFLIALNCPNHRSPDFGRRMTKHYSIGRGFVSKRVLSFLRVTKSDVSGKYLIFEKAESIWTFFQHTPSRFPHL
jgi:hypothetical protein